MKFATLILLGATALAAATGRKAKTDADGNTLFNGVKVPPLLEITPDTFEKEKAASKFLLIKHYSPYCPHCIDFAPTYQTLYEYYYTSKPVGHEDAAFTEFYDFRFATINCVAFFDLCSALKVASYPSTILYVDGEATETVKGVKGMELLTETLEPYLEKQKPGTRPKLLSLPEPGDKESPDFNAAAAITSDAKVEEAEKKEEVKIDAPAKAAPAEEVAVTPSEPKEPPKPVEIFNPDGISVALTAETFPSLVTNTEKPWFVKFYAPWCHHCQAMAPNWLQMAKEMKDKLNIGEVNCEVEKTLCKEAGVSSYPTIMFIKGTDHVEYEGLRGIGDFVQYASSAVEAARDIPDVDASALKALEEKEDVIFIYFYDHATTSEDFMALERLPLSLIGHARIVKTKDEELAKRYKITTFPRLLVSRDGRPTYYNPLTPREIRDVPALQTWMKSVWLPIVPELTISNSREVMDNKLVVLGIVNRDDKESFDTARQELKTAANEWMDKQIQAFQTERQELRDAKQTRIDEAKERGDERAEEKAKGIRVEVKMKTKEVAFAWVDGVFWRRWLKSTYGIDVLDGGERVIVNDEGKRRYWDTTITGNNILMSHASILDTLSNIATPHPQISAKSTLGSFHRFFFSIRILFVEHPFLTVGFIITAVVGGLQWLRRRTSRGRGGHFRDDSWSTRELVKDGLLGGGMNGNGKVD